MWVDAVCVGCKIDGTIPGIQVTYKRKKLYQIKMIFWFQWNIVDDPTTFKQQIRQLKDETGLNVCGVAANLPSEEGPRKLADVRGLRVVCKMLPPKSACLLLQMPGSLAEWKTCKLLASDNKLHEEDWRLRYVVRLLRFCGLVARMAHGASPVCCCALVCSLQ